MLESLFIIEHQMNYNAAPPVKKRLKSCENITNFIKVTELSKILVHTFHPEVMEPFSHSKLKSLSGHDVTDKIN